MLKNKKATLSNDEMIGFIIGAAVFIILIVLFRELIFSFLGSDDLEESSDSYFNTFVNEISKADDGNVGEFTMYKRLIDEGELDVFLIYFGDRFAYSVGERKFISTNNKNSICVCFWDGTDAVCKRKNCMDLSNPVNFDGDYGQWAISTGDQINITKVEDEYIFGRMGFVKKDNEEEIVRSAPIFLREVKVGDILRDKVNNKFEVIVSIRNDENWEITFKPFDGNYMDNYETAIVGLANSKLIDYDIFGYYINETKSGEIYHNE